MNKEEMISRWNALEEALDGYFNLIDSWTEEQRKFQPNGEWSANQVTEHMISSETGTFGYMKKKSSSGWEILEVTGQENKQNSETLNSRLSSDLRIKAPAVLPEPGNAFPHEGMKAQWKNMRIEMKSFFDAIDPIHYDKLVFKQPVAGMLNVLQTMEFLTNHIHHHYSQIHRIAAAQQI